MELAFLKLVKHLVDCYPEDLDDLFACWTFMDMGDFLATYPEQLQQDMRRKLIKAVRPPIMRHKAVRMTQSYNPDMLHETVDLCTPNPKKTKEAPNPKVLTKNALQ